MLTELVGNIDPSIRHQWALGLAEKALEGSNKEHCQLLGQLYSSKGEEEWIDVILLLKSKCEHGLQRKKEVNTMANLCATIPELQEFVVDHATNIFETYLTSSNVITDFRPFVSPAGDDDDDMETECLYHLEILYNVLRQQDKLAIPENLFIQLANLHGSLADQIVVLASKALGLLMSDPDSKSRNSKLIWHRICALLEQELSTPVYVSAGHKLWLRWCSQTIQLADQPFFQSLLSGKTYWQKLLKGITSKRHDSKKFCLHILTTSLQLIGADIDNQYMKWDPVEQDRYVQEWKRFTTLTEIIAVDSSLNQTQDSIGDLLSILSSESLIPASWAIGLISAGLSSSMDSVRRCIALVVLHLETKSLKLFSQDIDFVCGAYLGNVMASQYFHTDRKTATCEHFDLLSSFVRRFITALDDSHAGYFVAKVFELFDANRYLFDPARVSVFRGVQEGIENRSILRSHHLDLLAKLYSIRLETAMKKQAVFVLVLDILASVKCTENWLRALNNFVVHNRAGLSDGLLTKIANMVDKRDLYSEMMNNQDVDIALKFQIGVKLGADPWHEFAFEQRCEVLKNSVDDMKKKICTNLNDQFMSTLKERVSLCEYASCQVAEIISRYCDISVEAPLSKDSYEQLAASLLIGRLNSSLSYNEAVAVVLSEFNGGTQQRLRWIREAALVEAYIALRSLAQDTDSLPPVMEKMADHFQTSDMGPRLAIIRALEALLGRAATIDGDVLGSTLKSIWEAMKEDGFQLSERELQLKFISVAFSKPCLGITNVRLDEIMEGIANEIVEYSHGRRTLGPHLAKTLYAAEFKPWIARLFTYMYTFRQLNDGTFSLEPVIAKLLDYKLAMDGVVVNNYLQYYKEYEITARIYAIAYLSNMDRGQGELFEHIVSSNRYMTLHRLTTNADEFETERILGFQVLLLLEPWLTEAQVSEQLESLIYPMVDEETSPLVRVYVEWIMGRMLCRQPDNLEPLVLEPLEKPKDYPPRVLASLARVGVMVGRYLKENTDIVQATEYYRDYISRLVPLATSNKAITRHFAVSILYAIYCEYESFSDEFKAYLSDVLLVVKGIAEAAQQSDAFKTHRSGNNLLWGLQKDYTLVGICGGVLKRVSDRENLPIVEQKYWNMAFGEGSSFIVPVGREDSTYWQPERPASTTESPKPIAAALSNMLQTKSGVWNASVEALIEEGENTHHKMQVQRGEMVVLASLVDKAPNLGGICRLCDVLGAGLLCMDNLEVANNSQFKSVAVTADRWMPMKQVRLAEIRAYLTEMRQRGYTLIGLEQTDNSVQLNNDLKFPRKSVLLLGKEREGIPGELLAELDFCVEIKQVGVIRSMNIQTATAVVVYAYSSQHC